MAIAVRPPLGYPSGQNDDYTKVLLHFDGSSGGTTITESARGGSAHTWTATSGAILSTSQSKFGTAVLDCATSNTYVTTPHSTDLDIGASDFTIDFWYRKPASNGAVSSIAAYSDAGATASSRSVEPRVTGTLGPALIIHNTTFTATTITGTSTLSVNTWYHLAFVKASNVIKIFVNGVQDIADTTYASTINTSSATYAVGGLGVYTGGQTCQAFLDEFRITNGIARWTSNFTPPTVSYGSN